MNRTTARSKGDAVVLSGLVGGRTAKRGAVNIAKVDKLQIVDPSATIRRHACTGCGVHMFGPVENKAILGAKLHPYRTISPTRGGRRPNSPPSYGPLPRREPTRHK